jgi:hypothetical protein
MSRLKKFSAGKRQMVGWQETFTVITALSRAFAYFVRRGLDSDHPTLVNALLSLEKETEKGPVSRPAFPLLIYNYFQGLPSIIC